MDLGTGDQDSNAGFVIICNGDQGPSSLILRLLGRVRRIPELPTQPQFRLRTSTVLPDWAVYIKWPPSPCSGIGARTPPLSDKLKLYRQCCQPATDSNWLFLQLQKYVDLHRPVHGPLLSGKTPCGQDQKSVKFQVFLPFLLQLLPKLTV